MNREILIDALEELDGGVIERYYEIKEKLLKKRINRKMMMRSAISAACVVLVIGTVIPLVLKLTETPELPVDDTTVDIGNVTTDPPIEGTHVFDPKNVLHKGYDDANWENADLDYINWNGLEISTDLQSLLRYGQEYMYAISVFRRDGKDFYSTYRYEGKTFTELSNQAANSMRQIFSLNELLNYGEILKYGKEILTTVGVPDDEPIAEIRGRRMTEKSYDEIVARINYNDPLTLSRYIEDGVFLKEKAQSDYDLYCSVKLDFENKWNEMREAYFCRYEPEDVSFFEEMGFITGEINGRLYIIVSYEQFARLGERAKMSRYTFVPLPEDDFYAAYPINDRPDDQ